MFQLINTSWLFALAALSIPLLIHLWNIRQGKVLKVGSVSLLTAASKQSSRSFNLTDVLLLLVRCLLLTLVALLLAWPLWQKHIAATKAKGWVLIPKETLTETYHQFKPQVDSLQKAGYELHEYNAGFKLIDSIQLKQALHKKADSPTTIISNYWALLSQLNSRINTATPVYLFTPHQLKHFSGEKPAVALNPHWQTYTPADSVSTWIEKAWLTQEHNIRVVQGSSRPAGTTYSTATISNSPGPNSLYKIETAGGRLTIALKEGNTSAIAVDTSTLRFAIYTDVNTVDASYLKAALQTITQFTLHKAIVQQYTNITAISGNQNWLFWLSAQPLPSRLINKATHILQYMPGTPVTVSSWINTLPKNRVAGNLTDITLYKTIAIKHNTGLPVWTDGFGQSLLSLHKQGQQQFYHFYSRFNPAWNELVWNDRFPQVLYQLIEAPSAYNPVNDRRVIARRQYLPLKGDSAYIASPHTIKETDLRFAFWIAVALLFLMERWLAHRTQNSLTHG